MANAKRRRTQRTDDDDFNMPLADALAQLLPARHILPGATWYFRLEGDQLVITRSVPTVSTPDPDS
jgi:hypothetical protein